MSFKWKDMHMELFLETYKEYECLWNNKSSEYSNSKAREKAYNSMLADLNLPGLTVAGIKSKIKTIRTRYMAELSRIRRSERSGVDADEVYEPRLFWFKDADVFLRNVSTPKPGYSNLNVLQLTEKDTYEKATEDNTHWEQLEQQTADVEDIVSETSDNVENDSTVTVSSPKVSADLNICKKGRKRSLNTSISGVHTAIKRLKEISEENKQDLNEFDVFCESLAIQLKKMPLNRALICQEKLQNVMTQERLFQLGLSHQSHPSTSSSP